MSERRLTILSICGSLRAKSVNVAALAAAKEAAPPNVEIRPCEMIDGLPHYNPDRDCEPLPAAVAELRNDLAQADAVLISTPEYAGSLPGSFKNLLDWTVGGGSLYRRPVGWVNPSSHGGAQDAYRALRLVLDKTGAQIVHDACADIPVRRDEIGADGMIADPSIRAKIHAVVRALALAALQTREPE